MRDADNDEKGRGEVAQKLSRYWADAEARGTKEAEGRSAAAASRKREAAGRDRADNSIVG